MKQATGELNVTIVVVISVGILLAFFYGVLWPMIKGNLSYTQNCNNAICDKGTFDKNTGRVTCQYVNKDGNPEGNSFTCPWRG